MTLACRVSLRGAGLRVMASLLAILALLPRSRLGAQARDTLAANPARRDSALMYAAQSAPHWRDPRIATALGILHPGLGHYYAGEYEKGFRIEAITLGSTVAGLALAFPPSLTDPRSESRTRRELANAGVVVAALVGATAWVYGAIDAPHAARRENQLHGLAFGGVPRVGCDRDTTARAPLLANLRTGVTGVE